MNFNGRNMHSLSRGYYWDNNIKTIKSLGGYYTAHHKNYFFKKALIARIARYGSVRMLGRLDDIQKLSIRWLTICHSSSKRKIPSVSEISVKDDKDVYEL